MPTKHEIIRQLIQKRLSCKQKHHLYEILLCHLLSVEESVSRSLFHQVLGNNGQWIESPLITESRG